MRRFASIAALACALGTLHTIPAAAQNAARVFTHADTLRGSIGPGRAWWDVAFYDLHVRIDPADSSISGWNGITYRVTGPQREMQIDLMMPLVVDSMVQDGRHVSYRRDGNAFFATLAPPQPRGALETIAVYYHGRPHIARRPPWSGGFIWARDSAGDPWVATANQGIGASVWWPNKDTQADEPDSQRIAITVPSSMIDVSNGRLRHTTKNPDGTTTYEWFVADPINNYDVAVNAGAYAHYHQIYEGIAGPLTLDFWPLAEHLKEAEGQWEQARSMMRCFEGWFGPYPWYRDGYKLVEAPHLGMEHQSAVAYGNHYENGYLGRDLSHTGIGLQWDFIVVHESAHEWFGNNITTADVADMWVHESFANYAESLYTECLFGKDAGERYVRGTRRNIRNDRPIVGPYGVNAEGSGDMYYKGGNMLNTIRRIIDDDVRWRGILRGLNTHFRHQVVTGAEVEHYISEQAGIDLSRVFDEYLRTTMVPTLEYHIAGGRLRYRWADVVTGFDMPVDVRLSDNGWTRLYPTTHWQEAPFRLAEPAAFEVDPNYYISASDVSTASP